MVEEDEWGSWLQFQNRPGRAVGGAARAGGSSCHAERGVGEAADTDGDSPPIPLKHLAVSCDNQGK